MTKPRASFGMPLIADLLDKQKYSRNVDGDLIAHWSLQSSRAGKKTGNMAAISGTARHFDKCATAVYEEITCFKTALTSALVDVSERPAAIESFADVVYRDRGNNQRLRFEAAIAIAASCAQKLQLVATTHQDVKFRKGRPSHDDVAMRSIFSSEDRGVQAYLLVMAQSLIAASHAAMTGFLSVAGWSESLCRALRQESTDIFADYHPDSRWLAEVGLNLLPEHFGDESRAVRASEIRALGWQTIASAYRQKVAYRRAPREQKRYLSLAKQFALIAKEFRTPGGVNQPFIKTFDVLENPGQFDSLPWKSRSLGLTEALEVANAGIMARRFKEAQTVLENVADRIPKWHLPVRSRAVRQQLACRLALRRSSTQLRDEAHELCRLLPHDNHMLQLVEEMKGDLRRIYPG